MREMGRLLGEEGGRGDSFQTPGQKNVRQAS